MVIWDDGLLLPLRVATIDEGAIVVFTIIARGTDMLSAGRAWVPLVPPLVVPHRVELRRAIASFSSYAPFGVPVWSELTAMSMGNTFR